TYPPSTGHGRTSNRAREGNEHHWAATSRTSGAARRWRVVLGYRIDDGQQSVGLTAEAGLRASCRRGGGDSSGAVWLAELKAGQASQGCEAVVGPGPMTADHRGAGVAHDRAEHEADDDGVVRVAEHRHEVGHEVDRDREVAEQQPEPHAGGTRHASVTGQA